MSFKQLMALPKHIYKEMSDNRQYREDPNLQQLKIFEKLKNQNEGVSGSEEAFQKYLVDKRNFDKMQKEFRKPGIIKYLDEQEDEFESQLPQQRMTVAINESNLSDRIKKALRKKLKAKNVTFSRENKEPQKKDKALKRIDRGTQAKDLRNLFDNWKEEKQPRSYKKFRRTPKK